MTRPAAPLIYQTAGRPPLVKTAAQHLQPHPAVCTLCNQHTDTTAPAHRALGNNFTDRTHHTGPDNNRVCTACLWAVTGRGVNAPRPWTILCTPGHPTPPHADKAQAWAGTRPGLAYLTRAHTRHINQHLLNPPTTEWSLNIAVSGQKHLIPYTTTNTGTGPWTIRYETTNITATPTHYRHILDTVTALRRAGHRDTDIKTGRPTHTAIKTRTDLDTWHTHAQTLAPYQTAPITDLALWTLTKDTLNDDHAK